MRERGQYGEGSPKRAGEGAPRSRLRWLSREEEGQREWGSQEVRERVLRLEELSGKSDAVRAETAALVQDGDDRGVCCPEADLLPTDERHTGLLDY